MANEIMTLEQASKEIDRVVAECVPYTGMQMSTFSQTLALAKGIDTLRKIFDQPDIKATVLAMQDTRLGFLTDRSPKAVAKAKRDGKDLYPYSYNDIKECCIEAMLKGYRISNNEFNVIANNFYPAKEGKYRKIIEHPDITDFIYTTTSPAYEPDGKNAKVQCFASWKKGGVQQSIGTSDPNSGKQDTLVFRIRVNAMMGEDAIVGKALSKLFGRVLSRVEGRALVESEDLEYSAIDVTPTNGATVEDPTEKIHKAHEEAKKNGKTKPITKNPDDPRPEKKDYDFLKEAKARKEKIIALDGNDVAYKDALDVYNDAKHSTDIPPEKVADFLKDVDNYIANRELDGPPAE